jgi:disulfide bond formation protein DsbB
MTRGFAITLDALGLYGIALVLATAFAAQLLLGELPCPLCLMQRIQFAMLAAGLRFRAARLSLLYLGLYRFCRCDRSHRNRAAV